MPVRRCHQLLSKFLVNGHLPHFPRISRLLLLSTIDKGDHEMIPGTVHRSPGIYFTVVEKPGRLQIGDRLMKAVQMVITSNGELIDRYAVC